MAAEEINYLSTQSLKGDAVAISSSRIPAAFSGFRIAQVSDLHNAEFGRNNAELLSLLSGSRPDIIVITGNLIDARRTNVEIALCFAQESVRIAPTYYVTSNYEAASPQYDTLKAGLFTDGSTSMVVSRGIGNSIIPFRFNNRPGIVLVELNAR